MEFVKIRGYIVVMCSKREIYGGFTFINVDYLERCVPRAIVSVST